MAIDLDHQAPCLVNELYPIKITITNNEEGALVQPRWEHARAFEQVHFTNNLIFDVNKELWQKNILVGNKLPAIISWNLNFTIMLFFFFFFNFSLNMGLQEGSDATLDLASEYG